MEYEYKAPKGGEWSWRDIQGDKGLKNLSKKRQKCIAFKEGLSDGVTSMARRASLKVRVKVSTSSAR